MVCVFGKRVAGFPPWCIGFTFLYVLFYISWMRDYHRKYVYPLQQVTYNNTYSKKESCHDPIYFIYPYHRSLFLLIGTPLHKNMIVSYGFKNQTCPNIKRFDNNCSDGNGIYCTQFLCAKYNNKLHSKEFCNGGQIIWQPHPNIVEDLTKANTNKILTRYCNNYHKMDNICNFQLLTYNMDDLQQRIQFLTKHIDCTNNNSQPNKTWLFKEFKHEGNGIHFENNHNLIYSLIGPTQSEETQYYNKCTNVSSLQTLQTSEYFKNEGFDYVKRNDNTGGYRVNYNGLTMQEFISNPLLIENRAFHIRTLLLIPSYENPLMVLQYTRWQIFRNVLEYNNSELDPMRLRSNIHVSNNFPDKLKDANGTVLFMKSFGYNRFQKYLRDNYNQNGINHTQLENRMQKDMKDITTNIFKARSYYNKLRKLNLRNMDKMFNNTLRFDIACMDTVLNDKFELKFLEMNFWCGYFCNGKEVGMVGDDYEFCPAFANETSDILMEIYEKQKNGIEIKNISSLNKFAMVYFEK